MGGGHAAICFIPRYQARLCTGNVYSSSSTYLWDGVPRTQGGRPCPVAPLVQSRGRVVVGAEPVRLVHAHVAIRPGHVHPRLLHRNLSFRVSPSRGNDIIPSLLLPTLLWSLLLISLLLTLLLLLFTAVAVLYFT